MDWRSRSADHMHLSILPHTQKDSAENLEPETLDLSKKRLASVSEDLYRDNPAIKSVHLEGNTLCSLPEHFFLHLPHLVWLDLRNNKITSLPSSIGSHRQLQYLLLEGNPIRRLPIELGDLSTLKALNLRHCPLEFPPEEIVHKGLASILSFLRSFKKEDPVSPEAVVEELPPVEKLNLKELRSSMDLSGDWSSSEEKKTFEMLKHKIEEKQMEEMAQNRKPQMARDPAKGTGWKFFTESRPAMLVERRKSEAERQAEEKERLAVVIQKQRNEQILKDWQQQTKLMQDQKARSKTRAKNHHEVKVPAPPFATDLDTAQHKNGRDKQKSLADEKHDLLPRVTSANSLREMEKARWALDFVGRNIGGREIFRPTPGPHRVFPYAREFTAEAGSRETSALEHRIKLHIQSMQERRRKPKRSAQEEMAAARKELQVASLLQAEILQRKQEQDAALEYRFTAFTGEISPQFPPTGGPQNILATTL